MRPYNIDSRDAIYNPEYNVQSVCLGLNRIIVGMRSGSIHEVPLQEDGRGISQRILKSSINEENIPENSIRTWLHCSDHEIPKSVAMDMMSLRIFTITVFGLFQCWDLYQFNQLYTKNYLKRVRFIQSFRLQHKVMIVFENDIIVLSTDPRTNNFDEIADYSLTLNLITACTLNQNEQLLGVATINSSGAPEISLYSTDKGFMRLKQIFGFKSSIRYLDFSTDNYYM